VFRKFEDSVKAEGRAGVVKFRACNQIRETVMGGINIGRWFIGGVVAGIVFVVVDFVLNGMILAARWAEAMTALGLPPMGEGAGTIVFFIVIDLIAGLAAIWIYAGIRPRFGAGAMTAVYAGVVTWVLLVLLPNSFVMSSGLLPANLLTIVIVVGVFQIVAGTVAGAYFYREDKA
jgi:hypothetical protein